MTGLPYSPPPPKLFSLSVCVFFTKLFYFIYFWLHWVFVAACGLSLVVASGGYSVAVRGLLTAVSSFVAETGSVVVARRL